MTERKLSKKTLKSVYNRHYQLLGSYNYERQMSTGYAWTMMPAMKELYGDNPDELQAGVKRHLEFFNCATTPSPFIIGITCAMEEQNANDKNFDVSSISAVKTALMGPLAGIGDSFFWGTVRIIGAAIGAPLAVAGNALGSILYFLINFVTSEIVRRVGFKTGYEGGNTFLMSISKNGTLNKITESAKILGLTVIGSMIVSMVNFKATFAANINGAEFVLQDIFDSICPFILPLGLTWALYKALQKKISASKLMIGLLVFCILGSVIGLF